MDAAKPAAGDASRWIPLSRILLAGGFSAFLLWLAMPGTPGTLLRPLQSLGWLPTGETMLTLWPLGWIAPLGWMLLVADRRKLSFAGGALLLSLIYAHWLGVMQGIRLAHWAAYFGWAALAVGTALFHFAILWLARRLVHLAHWPLTLAVPIAWVGLIFLRIVGPWSFGLAMVSHTQASAPLLLQMADLGGAQLVSFLMLVVVAAIVDARLHRGRPRWLPLAVAGTVLVVIVGYGAARMYPPGRDEGPRARVALLQGTEDTIFDDDRERALRMFRQYRRLSEKAMRSETGVDVIVWPETSFADFGAPDGTLAAPGFPLATRPAEEDAGRREILGRYPRFVRAETARLVRLGEQAQGRSPQTRLVLGVSAAHLRSAPGDFGPDGPQFDRYNSALLVHSRGDILNRYDKIQPVMFGEYVPLGEQFPFLYALTPIPQGLTPGQDAAAFPLTDEVVASPNICFESTVGPLIRWQTSELHAAGRPPDVIVNLTNDGWFWGSSILDLHLACSVCRAIENHRPVLISANTGITADIDRWGRIQQRLPRRTEGLIVAEVRPASGLSPYVLAGDVFGWLTLAAAIAGLVQSLVLPRR